MSITAFSISSDQIMEKLIRRFTGFRYQKMDHKTQSGFEVATTHVQHNGMSTRMHFRLHTTDEDLVKMIFHAKCMYQIPDCVQPQVIFDCGANIGATAVYFAMQYPQATIYCFEPLPENLELLTLNTRYFGDRIKVLPYGLSNQVGSFTYNMSANPNSFGGGTFCKIGGDDKRCIELPVRTLKDVIEELGITQVDMLKLDTEGSEYAILQGADESVYRNAQALVGELHGVNDWDFCNMIDQSHNIGINKAWDRRCYEFVAIRRDLKNDKPMRIAA